MSITTEQATAWFANRLKDTPMPGAREMFDLAAAALREKAEREDPQALTLEELRQMEGEPVFVDDLRNKEGSQYCVISIGKTLKCQDIDHYSAAYIAGIEYDWYPFSDYGKTWLAYRHKPKEAQK
jgi:hypothetical protein